MERQYIIILFGFFLLFFYSCALNTEERGSSQINDSKDPKKNNPDKMTKEITEE